MIQFVDTLQNGPNLFLLAFLWMKWHNTGLSLSLVFLLFGVSCSRIGVGGGDVLLCFFPFRFSVPARSDIFIVTVFDVAQFEFSNEILLHGVAGVT